MRIDPTLTHIRTVDGSGIVLPIVFDVEQASHMLNQLCPPPDILCVDVNRNMSVRFCHSMTEATEFYSLPSPECGAV